MHRQILKNTIFIGLFLIPFVPFLVSSAFFFPFITTKAFAFRIIVEIIFAAWILLTLVDKDVRPKRTLILYSLLAFLVVVGAANIFGAEPGKSFWSNFERMEGYITLLHLGAFFLVISSIFNEIDWRRWFNTTLAASFIMVCYCSFQLLGALQIHQGGVRVDGTLGNASYLAVYMLIHIFLGLWLLFKERRSASLKWLYGILIFLQLVILYHTATRGAILGLLGALILVALLNVRNGEERGIRKLSITSLAALLLFIGGFYLARNSEFVKSSPVLSRFASITTEEIKQGGRSFVWPMAIKGFLDKPLLGWGQENFNYVFNRYYDPAMFRLEPWFDRAHNIFLDWLTQAGILGLLAYLSLYAALIYLIWKDTQFGHLEKSILTGLVAAYFFHNLFVFDHLISYILFFSVLAYIHSRSGGRIIGEEKVMPQQSSAFIASGVVALLLLTLYFGNIKPIIANTNLISALSEMGSPSSVTSLEKAYKSSRLGRPEAIEQIVSHSRTIFSGTLPAETKTNFFNFSREAVLKQAEDFREDARYQLIAGTFLTTSGNPRDAIPYYDRAIELMPGKQIMYFERGSAYINLGENAKALEDFRTAYEMAAGYKDATIIYLLGSIYSGDRTLENSLKLQLSEQEIVLDDRVLSAYLNKNRTEDAIRLLERRKVFDPANAENYDAYINELRK